MKNLNEEKRWFGIYEKLPKWYAIAICVLTVIWSIVDVCVFRYYGDWNKYYNRYEVYYGIFGWQSWFLVLLVWWIIGIIIAAISYIILKISTSPMILQTEYLEMIAENTTPKTPNSPQETSTFFPYKKQEKSRNAPPQPKNPDVPAQFPSKL